MGGKAHTNEKTENPLLALLGGMSPTELAYRAGVSYTQAHNSITGVALRIPSRILVVAAELGCKDLRGLMADYAAWRAGK